MPGLIEAAFQLVRAEAFQILIRQTLGQGAGCGTGRILKALNRIAQPLLLAGQPGLCGRTALTGGGRGGFGLPRFAIGGLHLIFF